jgi:hypothetical protein
MVIERVRKLVGNMDGMTNREIVGKLGRSKVNRRSNHGRCSFNIQLISLHPTSRHKYATIHRNFAIYVVQEQRHGNYWLARTARCDSEPNEAQGTYFPIIGAVSHDCEVNDLGKED